MFLFRTKIKITFKPKNEYTIKNNCQKITI